MITEIRCSKLARPMVCAGFLSFENLPDPEDAGLPAQQGTAYGEYIERCLLGHSIPEKARNGIYFDDDMRFWAKGSIDEIRSNVQGDIRCEQRIDWQTRSGIWIRGSYDISFVRDGALYIDDNKYGWGIVEVRENWQLLGYAIGEVIRRQTAFEKIVLRIHQPRPHHEDGWLRAWELSYGELLAYKEKIEARMDEIAAGNRQLQTSKSCKYCPAAAESCPAFNRLFYRSLEVSTEFTQDQIDELELSRQLDHVGRAMEVLKIKQDSLTELATTRIKTGKIVPGYVTEERYGDRRWKPGTDPAAIKILTGVDLIDAPAMLSPAKAEKAGIHKKFVNQFVDRPFLGMKVVRKDASDVGNKIFGRTAPVMGEQ